MTRKESFSAACLDMLILGGGEHGGLLEWAAMEACFRVHDRSRAIVSQLHWGRDAGSGPLELSRPRGKQVSRASFFRHGGPWRASCAAANRGGLRRIALRTRGSVDSFRRTGPRAAEISGPGGSSPGS